MKGSKENNDVAKPGFGDTYEYKGKFYTYIDEIKVKVRNGKTDEWVTYISYYNQHGKFAREKKEFFNRFNPVK